MDDNRLTYSNSKTKEEYKYIIKIVLSYLLIISVWIATVKIYKTFGESWIMYGICAMWIIGAITAFVIAGERDNTVKQTKMAILAYCCVLLLYRWVLQKVSPITSDQLGASLSLSTSSTSGTAITNLLQTLLVYLSVLTPIGYLIWCGQKFKVFRKTKTRQEETDSLKGFVKDRRKK